MPRLVNGVWYDDNSDFSLIQGAPEYRNPNVPPESQWTPEQRAEVAKDPRPPGQRLVDVGLSEYMFPGYNQHNNVPPPQPPVVTPPTTNIPNYSSTSALGGYYGGGGGFGGQGFYTPPEPFEYDPFSFKFNQPTFEQQPEFSYDPFAKPSLEEAQQQPGYQFRMQEGQRALENSAAARGMLRSGRTMKDLTRYGQQFGEQAYQNVYDRDFGAWQANRAAAADEWAKNYQRNLDTYRLGYESENDRFNRALAAWQGNLGLATTGHGFEMQNAAQLAQSGYQGASLGLQQQQAFNNQGNQNIRNLIDIASGFRGDMPSYTPPVYGGGSYNAGGGAIGPQIDPGSVVNTGGGGSSSGAFGTVGGQSPYQDPNNQYGMVRGANFF